MMTSMTSMGDREKTQRNSSWSNLHQRPVPDKDRTRWLLINEMNQRQAGRHSAQCARSSCSSSPSFNSLFSAPSLIIVIIVTLLSLDFSARGAEAVWQDNIQPKIRITQLSEYSTCTYTTGCACASAYLSFSFSFLLLSPQPFFTGRVLFSCILHLAASISESSPFQIAIAQLRLATLFLINSRSRQERALHGECKHTHKNGQMLLLPMFDASWSRRLECQQYSLLAKDGRSFLCVV